MLIMAGHLKLNEQFELSFDLNCSSETALVKQEIFVGELATKPNVPIRKNYTFKGWNTKNDGSGTTWNFTKSTMPTNNVILYNKWEVKEISSLPNTVSSLSITICISMVITTVFSAV